MIKEINQITKDIEKNIINYFKLNKEVEMIIAINPNEVNNYYSKSNIEYIVIVLSNNSILKDKIVNFEIFLNYLSKKLTTNKIDVKYLSLISDISYRKCFSKTTILLKTAILTKDKLADLYLTINYKYNNKYKVLYGKDYLKNIKLNMNDKLSILKELNNCINMLKQQDNVNQKQENKSNLEKQELYNLTEEVLERSIFNVNFFVENFIKYCNHNNLDIPDEPTIFCIRLLGKEYCTEKTLFLLAGLLNNDLNLIKAIFSDPIYSINLLLENIKKRIDNLENIFIKKENKIKKLIKVK